MAGSFYRRRDDRDDAGAKFADYFHFAERLATLPSYRIPAVFGAEREEILDLSVGLYEET